MSKSTRTQRKNKGQIALYFPKWQSVIKIGTYQRNPSQKRPQQASSNSCTQQGGKRK